MNTLKPIKKSNVVARLTVEFQSGLRESVEIHTDASFNQFFNQYRFISARKKLPKEIATFNRSYSQTLPRGFNQSGLEGMLSLITNSYRAKTNPVVKSKLVIYKKRLYRQLLTIAPDQLPGGGLPIAARTGLGPVIPKWDKAAPIRISRNQERESRIFRKHPISTGFGRLAVEVKADA